MCCEGKIYRWVTNNDFSGPCIAARAAWAILSCSKGSRKPGVLASTMPVCGFPRPAHTARPDVRAAPLVQPVGILAERASAGARGDMSHLQTRGTSQICGAGRTRARSTSRRGSLRAASRGSGQRQASVQSWCEARSDAVCQAFTPSAKLPGVPCGIVPGLGLSRHAYRMWVDIGAPHACLSRQAGALPDHGRSGWAGGRTGRGGMRTCACLAVVLAAAALVPARCADGCTGKASRGPQ